MIMKTDIRVLYVDDEKINTFIFERMLNDYFGVITANTGEEGIEILRKESDTIKAVISDMRMPGMDGLTFIKKAKEEFPQLPFFLLTAFTDQNEIADAIESNLVTGCLHKPIEPDIISQEILSKVN
jgi:two-component system response regulator (stage 0 sporulation protein F)